MVSEGQRHSLTVIEMEGTVTKVLNRTDCIDITHTDTHRETETHRHTERTSVWFDLCLECGQRGLEGVLCERLAPQRLLGLHGKHGAGAWGTYKHMTM